MKIKVEYVVLYQDKSYTMDSLCIELVECKFVFRRDQATDEELQPYVDYIKVENPQATLDNIFETFPGELISYNEDYSTDRLRIRHWKWVLNDVTYDLLDVNAWPGDNESGTISVRSSHQEPYVTIGINSDRWIISEGSHQLTPYFEHFGDIRTLDSEAFPEGPDPDSPCEMRAVAFYQRESGKISLQLEDQAWETYKQKLNPIYKQFDEMKRKYVSEFEVDSKHDRCDEEVLKDAGYLDKCISDPFYREGDVKGLNIELIHFTWSFSSSKFKLLYVNLDSSKREVYLVKDTGLILLFDDWFSVSDTLVFPEYFELRKRVFTMKYIVLRC